jgi:hypothetical protein
MKSATVPMVFLTGLCLFGMPQTVRADELPKSYQTAVDKGLAWLANAQMRDGHWEAPGGAYPVAMTGLSGVALLMEGSTPRDGKYASHIRRTMDWVMNFTQPNGLISPLNGMGRGYMHDHGYALLFLGLVYGEEEDSDRRKHLQEVLTRAVEFTGKAQTARGGWGYVSATDSGGHDEGSVTVTQVQALRACRNAGIVVPKEIIDKGMKYLKDCTGGGGGVTYSSSGGGERPALTAAAVTCAFNSGDYSSPLVKRWLTFCRANLPQLGGGRIGHDEYTQYYWAQCVYFLGEEGWAKHFPDSAARDQMTWSKYRKTAFDFLVSSQSADGSWAGSGSWGHIGPVYSTAMSLTIMQLDKAVLPLYQR